MDAVNAQDAEPQIRGESTSEHEWQSWAGLSALDTFLPSHWLPVTARLVVVAPHPDDEILACGGLLAWQARRGGDCLVLAVTDGEASHGDLDREAAASLAAARRAESAAGLSHLGLRHDCVERLALPDGKVSLQVEALAARLRQLLRPEDRVISAWREDGHPDHEATALATAAACRDLGCPLLEAPVWMWHWAAPGDDRVPWRRLSRFALPQDLRARKVAALSAHLTQLTRRSPGEPAVLGPAIIERNARACEYFFA